jgi:cobalamin-dependent methionine synthase I
VSAPLWDRPQDRKETRRAKHRREKADQKFNVAVDRELARMGVEERAVAAAVRLNTDEIQEKLTKARWAAEPLEGAAGYLKLREAFTGVLLAEGVNMDDLE